MARCSLRHSHFTYDPNLSGSSAILRCNGCGGIWPDVLPEPGGGAMMHVAPEHEDIQGLLRAEIASLRAEVEELEREREVVEPVLEQIQRLERERDALLDRLAILEDGSLTNTRLVWLEKELQRAEAVVEAIRNYLSGDCTLAFLEDALAAWDEGKERT